MCRLFARCWMQNVVDFPIKWGALPHFWRPRNFRQRLGPFDAYLSTFFGSHSWFQFAVETKILIKVLHSHFCYLFKNGWFYFYFRWPRLHNLVLAEFDGGQNQRWLTLVKQRIEVSAKVRAGLLSMSTICYPHGEPPLALMKAMVSNNRFEFVEDVILEILFHTNK